MKLKLLAFIGSAVLLAGCQTTTNTRADAQYSKVVPVNGQIKLDFWAHLNPDCTSAGPISVTVIEQPQHGQAVASSVMDYTSFARSNSRYHCNLRRTPGVRAIYKPDRNYLGSDRASFRVIYTDGEQWIRRFQFDVK